MGTKKWARRVCAKLDSFFVSSSSLHRPFGAVRRCGARLLSRTHGITVSPRHDSGKDPATAEKARQAFFRNAPKKRKQQCLDYHCTYHCIVFKFLLLMSCWSSWKDVNKFQRVSSKKMSPWSPFSYTHSWQIFAFVITSILYGGTGEGRGTNRKTPIRGRKKWS